MGRSVPAEHAAPGPVGAALGKLYGDVEHDASVVNRFVADYLQLLHQRLDAILRMLTNHEFDALVVSLLSLETTSAMIGASDIVRVAKNLRDAVEDRQLEVAADTVTVLAATVNAVKHQLHREGFSDSHPVP